MGKSTPYFMWFPMVFLFFPAVNHAEELSGKVKNAYIVLYEQGRLEEAIKELNVAYAGNPNDDDYKIWKCLLDLEKASIIKERGESGYDKIAFENYLILKPLLGRNSDNPDYWFAVSKSFALNNSRRAKKSVEKAFFYREKFPEARLLQIELKADVDESEVHEMYQSLLKSEGVPPFVSAKIYIRLAQIGYKKYERAGGNTFDSKEIILERKAVLKNSIIANFEKAIAVAPHSAYKNIAEEQLKELIAK